jgi:hypothetical protein
LDTYRKQDTTGNQQLTNINNEIHRFASQFAGMSKSNLENAATSGDIPEVPDNIFTGAEILTGTVTTGEPTLSVDHHLGRPAVGAILIYCEDKINGMFFVENEDTYVSLSFIVGSGVSTDVKVLVF